MAEEHRAVALALISHHPEIKSLVDQIVESDKRFAEKKKFIVKQVESMVEEMEKEQDVLFKGIEAYIQEQGIAKDHDPKKHSLGFSASGDVLFSQGKCKHGDGLPDGLRDLVRAFAVILKP